MTNLPAQFLAYFSPAKASIRIHASNLKLVKIGILLSRAAGVKLCNAQLRFSPVVYCQVLSTTKMFRWKTIML